MSILGFFLKYIFEKMFIFWCNCRGTLCVSELYYFKYTKINNIFRKTNNKGVEHEKKYINIMCDLDVIRCQSGIIFINKKITRFWAAAISSFLNVLYMSVYSYIMFWYLEIKLTHKKSSQIIIYFCEKFIQKIFCRL
jgi:hypothetical protein